MKLHAHKHLVRILTAMGITLVAFGLSWVVAQPFSISMGTLMSSHDKKDFNMTDFYNIIADSRPVRTLDTDIVIVDIHKADRADIIDLLNILSIMQPKAVGLDVTFNNPRPGDSLLLAAIDMVPNLTLAQGVKDAGNGRFIPDDNSWFFDQTRHKYHYGVVNLPSKFDGATIRQLPMWFTEESGEDMPSFAFEIMRTVSPDDAKLQQDKRFETIDFPSREFTTLDWTEVPDRPDDIEGKIVLIGALGEMGDLHITPITDRMSGVMIHAYALSTILNGRYYSEVPRWANLLIAAALCMLMAYMFLTISVQVKGITLRIIQVILLYLIIRVGYYLFVDHRIIIDFSHSLLMLTFVLFACDIWIGSIYITNKIKNKICQHNTTLTASSR